MKVKRGLRKFIEKNIRVETVETLMWSCLSFPVWVVKTENLFFRLIFAINICTLRNSKMLHRIFKNHEDK